MNADHPPSIAAPSNVAHLIARFVFTIDAPIARAAPLFGPEGERTWAGQDWDPRFLHPAAARDVEGAVFTLAHGAHASVWVNTRFDLDQGRMQYVVFTPGVMTTTIDVALEPQAGRTLARVGYTRTALNAEANAQVEALNRADATKGPEWRDAIAAVLARRP